MAPFQGGGDLADRRVTKLEQLDAALAAPSLELSSEEIKVLEAHYKPGAITVL